MGEATGSRLRQARTRVANRICCWAGLNSGQTCAGAIGLGDVGTEEVLADAGRMGAGWRSIGRYLPDWIREALINREQLP
jgi:hypothetical protein